MEDFIRVYPDFLSPEQCQEIMEGMDKAYSLGYGYNRQTYTSHTRDEIDDMQLYQNSIIRHDTVISDETTQEFMSKFWEGCYKSYADKFSILQKMPPHGIFYNKLQRTEIGGGFHTWHCEQDGSPETAKRLLVYILYLNDVEDGGETEFLYLHKRFKPVQGTLVLWPAGFTHTHRGNPPLSNTKYIMTGWVEF